MRNALENILTSDSLGGIRGEARTGFEKGLPLGPFSCGNCRYFTGAACSQGDMRRYSRQPRLSNGDIAVDALDCCEYVDRTGILR